VQQRLFAFAANFPRQRGQRRDARSVFAQLRWARRRELAQIALSDVPEYYRSVEANCRPATCTVGICIFHEGGT
jgi:hypothetical protein